MVEQQYENNGRCASTCVQYGTAKYYLVFKREKNAIRQIRVVTEGWVLLHHFSFHDFAHPSAGARYAKSCRLLGAQTIEGRQYSEPNGSGVRFFATVLAWRGSFLSTNCGGRRNLGTPFYATHHTSINGGAMSISKIWAQTSIPLVSTIYCHVTKNA